jgi:hypothetical protein
VVAAVVASLVAVPPSTPIGAVTLTGGPWMGLGTALARVHPAGTFAAIGAALACPLATRQRPTRPTTTANNVSRLGTGPRASLRRTPHNHGQGSL